MIGSNNILTSDTGTSSTVKEHPSRETYFHTPLLELRSACTCRLPENNELRPLNFAEWLEGGCGGTPQYLSRFANDIGTSV